MKQHSAQVSRETLHQLGNIYLYRYIGTYTKLNGKELEKILNKRMNFEREFVFMELALHHLLISRYFRHTVSSQKLNSKERKSILIYCQLWRV